jgi:magnesium-protoporphyrin IX monomethyl ester (oxidative) cyclase
MKSQKPLLNTYEARLWSKFFLLSVFATMYLNDLQRSGFYATIGLDSRKFDIHVIRKTNQSSARLFPVILDVDHPEFFSLLDICSDANTKLIEIEKTSENDIICFLSKLPQYLTMAVSLLKLYFLPPIETKYIWTEK